MKPGFLHGVKALKSVGMRRRQWGLGAAAWLAASPWAAWAQSAASGAARADAPASTALPAPPSAAELFDQPHFSGAVLSPDGRKVAYRLRVQGERPVLMVTSLDTMESKAVANSDEVGIGNITWVNSERLVFDLASWSLASGERHVNPGLFAVNADGSRTRQLVEAQGSWVRLGGEQELLPQWTSFLQPGAGENAQFVWAAAAEAFDGKSGTAFMHLYKLNIHNGRFEEVDSPAHSVEWLFDNQDNLRAVVALEDNQRVLNWRDGADQPWRVLTRFDSLKRVLVPVRLEHDGTLWVISGDRGDTLGVYAWDFERNEVSSRALVQSPQYDLYPGFVVREGKLLGLRLQTDAAVTHWLDEGMKALQAAFDKALPNAVNRISVPQHGESPWLLIYSYSDTQPGSYLLFNRQTRKLVRLGDFYPGLKGRPFGSMDLVRIKVRDGMEIPVWLTLPPGGPQKNLPMVVLVHGGPWSRGNSWQWRADAQFLATRGYAVLQPEFRGSTGFGAKHFRAGWKQWGQAMQDDVTDATRWAIEQGTADARRIAIMGASYGGYATLMGLIREPDLYRCGVQWAGVTDPALLFDSNWTNISEVARKYRLTRLIGDPVKDAAKLDSVSPLKLAERIRSPLLMAYGGKDRTVPIVHGERLRDALIAAGHKRFEWVEYPKESHGWADLQTNVDFWGRVEKFLAQHLAPA